MALDAASLPREQIVESQRSHRGCGKFSRRFGVDALTFVNSEVGRELNLRGVNARVVSAGVVRPGDPIAVMESGGPRSPAR